MLRSPLRSAFQRFDVWETGPGPSALSTLKDHLRSKRTQWLWDCIVVHYEYMAHAKNTSVSREAMLFFVEAA